MSTVPAKTASAPTGQHQALFHSTLQEVAAQGGGVMGNMVEAARLALQAQEAPLRDPREREAVATAANQLRRQEQYLCTAYPQQLLKVFTSPQAGPKSQALSVAQVQFDQLELMDDAQVQTSVTLARIQQMAMQTCDASLSELNTLVCSLQGMATVRAEHNPLRPENFISALKDVVAQTALPNSVQLMWFNAMSKVLGPQLNALYLGLCASLRKQGVKPVLYAVPVGFGSHGGVLQPSEVLREVSEADDVEFGFQTQAAPLGSDAAPAAAAPTAHSADPTLLTLDKLRRLLTGELVQAPSGLSRVEQFAARFAQQFEDAAPAPKSAYAATVPAALEALTEMKQVERVVKNLEQRRVAAATPMQAHTIEGQRHALRQGARDVAQALSLEVVTLMVDNMARDPRLLEPVREVIRNLEPALLRLALVDPRFFTHKQHPARRLLHEVTHHSLGFESSSATGFDSFIQVLQGQLAPLFQAPVDSAEVFEAKLEALQRHWNIEVQSTAMARDTAVGVLAHAEARNLLAEKIARNIEAHPDTAKVPAVVVDFLCGPWAQVVAQARIKQGSGSAAAEKFEALVSALLWSAHPELARANPSKLSRLMPRLLTTLREGLDTIQYPGTRTSVFLEALMAIHQQVFRANMPAGTALPAEPPAAEPSLPAQAGAPERLYPVLDGDPWMAPAEAQASNFVELQEEVPEPAHTPEQQVAELPLGSWVELWANEQWSRTQLTWASPHGTLFLFTSAFGSTQSMTRRSRDKLLACGRLRLVSGQSVDEGALNAVAQTAMRNSVDTVF